MGGALILFAITVSTLLWADLSNRFIWVVLFVTLGYGSIGWIDDYRKVVHHNPKGMSAREKFSWQSVIGLAAAFYLVFALSVPAGGTLTETIAGWVEAGFPLDISSNLHLLIPCFKDIALPLGLVGFMVFTYVVIVGSSNAVNLTDGLDGLAILPSVMVGGALGIFAYVVGRPDYAGYLIFPYIPGAGELVVIAGGLLGAGLAFLWYNAHPAQVFMGDVGALALGGCLGTMAVITRQELVLALIEAAGLPVGPALAALAAYGGEPHRVERVLDCDGVTFIDDSKGTNVGAVAAAVKGFAAQGRRILIILGGDGKGQDFSPLVEALKGTAGAVALIGRDAPLIEEALSATGIPMARQTTLEEAVYWLWARHAQGDVLLLSPACASWDMFRDYAERSARFMACARAIAAEEQAC